MSDTLFFKADLMARVPKTPEGPNRRLQGTRTLLVIFTVPPVAVPTDAVLRCIVG